MIRILFVAVLVILLGGCATSSVPAGTKADTREALRFATKPGMGVIYVYRPARTMGALGKTYVEFDGKPHSRFNLGFTKIDVTPGQYTVTTYKSEDKLPRNTSSYLVGVEAGEVAILTVNVLRENNNELYQIANNQVGMDKMKDLPYYPGAFRQLSQSAAVVDQVKLLKEKEEAQARVKYDAALKQAQVAHRNKDYRKAVELYTQAILSSRERYTGDPGRAALIELVADLQHKPDAQDEFKKHTIRAKAYIDLEKFDAAANELMNAINAAPWLAEPYYNYALLEEKLGFPNRARWALQWFIKIGASPALMAKAQESLIRLDVLAEEKTALNRMNGYWRLENGPAGTHKVSVNGHKLTIVAPNNTSVEATISGNSIEGIFKGEGHKQNGCLIPGETVKLHGSSINPDRNRIVIGYTYTLYKTQFHTDFFGSQTCVSVTPYEKKDVSYAIVRKQ